MTLPKGWIIRQIARMEKDVATWPEWMKRGLAPQSEKKEAVAGQAAQKEN